MTEPDSVFNWTFLLFVFVIVVVFFIGFSVGEQSDEEMIDDLSEERDNLYYMIDNLERTNDAIIENAESMFDNFKEHPPGKHAYYINVEDSEITHIYIDDEFDFRINTTSYNEDMFIGYAFYLEGLGWTEIFPYYEWLVSN